LPGALSTVRVVDFGHYVAGPLAAMLLADAGAEVIHVDRPGAGQSHPSDAVYNRNKKRITLDLKHPDGMAAAQALVAEADILIENFRPGVMARLGLDAERLCAAHPGLIHCALPGFAPSDPRAALPGWEGVVQAASNGYRPLAGHYYTDYSTIEIDDPDRPLFNPVPLASNLAGMLGATAIVMALIARRRTGLGQSICLPLSEAMIEVLNMRLDMPDFGKGSPAGSFIGKYACADGRFLDLMAYPFRFIEWIVEHLGLAGEWRAEGLLDVKAIAADPVLTQRVEQKLVALFRSRTSAEWEALATELKVPLALSRTPGEWLRTEAAVQSCSVAKLDDPLLGPIRTAGLAVNFSESPGEIVPRSLPDADARFGGPRPTAPPQPARTALTQALKGIRVVDIATQVAGPTAGRILADFGAEVIKITDPRTPVLMAHVNRGKKTALIDIQKPAGRGILLDLVEQSDVYLHNFAQDAPPRYGIGLDALRERRHDLIYCSVSAYAYTGDWAARRGYEMEGQASAGMQTHYSGPDRWPLNHPMLVNDVGTGILGAFGIAAALYQRGEAGIVQQVNVSLSQTATLHQAHYLVLPEGEAELPSGGLDARGWHALQRLYRAGDGWLFLGASEPQRPIIAELLGIPEHDDASIEAGIEAQLATGPVERWISLLNAAGIAAHAVIGSSFEAAAAPALRERGVVEHHLSADGDLELHPAIGPWLSRTPPKVQPSSTPYGSDVLEILRSIGRDGDVVRLAADGVIAFEGPAIRGIAA
jgi:crotonobetainyl-CoA:carnitine CoA-transferase CaiB-like acyl-CoA transferase